MIRTSIEKLALTTLLMALAGGALLAQESHSPNETSEVVVFSSDEASAAAGAGTIIFSNLDAGNSYNPDAFAAKAVAGREAGGGQTERWDAVRFVPKVDVQATVLSAAIGWIQGTKLVNLALYSNDDLFNTVGDPLPGGGGSTRQIPDVGQCCELTTVTLPGEGVMLEAGVTYWLVATPDDVLGPTFSGGWQVSNRGSYAQFGPPFPWDPQSGEWPAAKIRGKRVQAQSLSKPAHHDVRSAETVDPAANVTIFTNLDRSSGGDLYNAGFGVPIAGNDASSISEIWLALPFTSKTDVHAKTLAAAIARVSGTKRVNLSIYTDGGGVPVTPLPGGQGSTVDFPDSGACCDLAQVRLPGAGVALSAGVKYWLVASPDNINAPDFYGIWQPSTVAFAAEQQPENFTGWIDFSGNWFAAEIRGTKD